jgi:hypothetical protein
VGKKNNSVSEMSVTRGVTWKVMWLWFAVLIGFLQQQSKNNCKIQHETAVWSGVLWGVPFCFAIHMGSTFVIFTVFPIHQLSSHGHLLRYWKLIMVRTVMHIVIVDSATWLGCYWTLHVNTLVGWKWSLIWHVITFLVSFVRVTPVRFPITDMSPETLELTFNISTTHSHIS